MNERELMEQEIRDLTCDLTADDYRVIKYMEYTAAGKKAPYDIKDLTAERQAKRDRINELQAAIATLDKQEALS